MKKTITEAPIFVLGSPRSGTSMLQWALRRHPRLWGSAESDFLIPLMEAVTEVHAGGTSRGRFHWLAREMVSRDEFLRWIGTGVNGMYTHRARGRRWVEQTPQYTLHLDDLSAMFPGAQFLAMVRDGRDVVESLRNFVEPMSHSRACTVWSRHTRAAIDFAEDQPDRIRLVSYERVVDDTSDALRDLFAFLGLRYQPAPVEFIRTEPRINSSFTTPPTAEPRWSGWSLSERQRFQRIAGDLLVDRGYEADDGWVRTGPVTEPSDRTGSPPTAGPGAMASGR